MIKFVRDLMHEIILESGRVPITCIAKSSEYKKLLKSKPQVYRYISHNHEELYNKKGIEHFIKAIKDIINRGEYAKVSA